MDYELIVPYIPNLRRYARALVGDRDGADDLVQDTLERAVRKFHLWRPGDLRAWLFSIMAEMVILAAALSIQDPRDRPQALREQSDRAHEEFRDESSDFLQLLNLWKFFDTEFLHKKSNRKLYETCREHFLSYVRMKVSRRAEEIEEGDLAALRTHGWTDEDIWDVAAISAFFSLSNRMANFLAMRPNDEFYALGR